jgi:twitching motility protein PilI
MQVEQSETGSKDTEAIKSMLDDSMIPYLQPRGQTVFGFQVGKVGFMVSSDTYCELLERLSVNPLPNVRPWFNGLLNLRGTLVPVFDLRSLLDDETVDNKKRRLFAIGRDDKAVAVWIDNHPQILDVAAMQVIDQLPELPAALQHSVAGGYLHEGRIWLSLQLDSLFKTLGHHQYTLEETAI